MAPIRASQSGLKPWFRHAANVAWELSTFQVLDGLTRSTQFARGPKGDGGDEHRYTFRISRSTLSSRFIWKGRLGMSWQFTVGLRVQGKADRIVVDAEDALIAALKAKADQPGATIMYVRRLNRRGDTRHPPHTLTGGLG